MSQKLAEVLLRQDKKNWSHLKHTRFSRSANTKKTSVKAVCQKPFPRHPQNLLSEKNENEMVKSAKNTPRQRKRTTVKS